MGNDEFFCELARPALSSVAVPTHEIGCAAAAILDRLLAGEPPPSQPVLFSPLGVVVRASSEFQAPRDPELAAAVRFIRQADCASVQVEDVLRAVPISRRSLERRFRQVLERGIHEEIQRVRVRRAALLLASTDLSVSAIAEQSGFSNHTHLGVVFRRENGTTPSAYRRQFRYAAAHDA
jgi:LacI family transcriptional regulator